MRRVDESRENGLHPLRSIMRRSGSRRSYRVWNCAARDHAGCCEIGHEKISRIFLLRKQFVGQIRGTAAIFGLFAQREVRQGTHEVRAW